MALRRFPAQQVRQLDVGRAFMRAEKIIGARTQNALLEDRLAQRRSTNALSKRATADLISQPQGGAPTNAMLAIREGGGATDQPDPGVGAEPASGVKMSGAFPVSIMELAGSSREGAIRAANLVELYKASNEMQRAEHTRKTHGAAVLAMNVLNPELPEKRKASAAK